MDEMNAVPVDWSTASLGDAGRILSDWLRINHPELALVPNPFDSRLFGRLGKALCTERNKLN